MEDSVLWGLMAAALYIAQMIGYSMLLFPFYLAPGGIAYLAMLRILKAVRKDDVDLVGRYLGSRIGFAVRVLALVGTDE